MKFGTKQKPAESFSMQLMPAVVIGSGICIAYYGAIYAGPLRYKIIERYSLCHPVAIASAWLFCIAAVVLFEKFLLSVHQMQLAREANRALRDVVDSRLECDGNEARNSHSIRTGTPEWLDTLWQSQKTSVANSWFGQRVASLVSRQIKRRSTKRLDDDIRELADRDADAQHGSYAMVRIITWAMPMLGFLGTVIGISDTLGQMDAQALASGSQEAMNSLTAGLYVAFDTTAVGLVLTMIAMFIQFGVNRSELALLAFIDGRVADQVHECLAHPEHRQDTTKVEAALDRIASELLASVGKIVERQAELWKETISTAHSHWTQLSTSNAETVTGAVSQALDQTFNKHHDAMSIQTESLVKIQAEGALQIDRRLQQWQTSISDQARVALRHQQEMNQQAEIIKELIDSTKLVAAMEAPIQSTLNRLTDVDRFHDAAVCLTEAVAVLGTQMERYGYLGRQPVRRRIPDDTLTPKPSLNVFTDEPLESNSLLPPSAEATELPSSKTKASNPNSKRKAG